MTHRMIPLLAILVPLMVASADDWPAWMGSARDGVYRETGIVDEIPADGLPVKWQSPIQGGYADPAVANGRVVVFDYERESGEPISNDPNDRTMVNGREGLVGFDSESGKQLWRHAYECPYSIFYPAGPRCTPTVDGNRVYILGSEGEIQNTCELRTGHSFGAVT